MAREIERKFLVDTTRLPTLEQGQRIVQGYMPTADKSVVRARIKGENAFLTLKGEHNGISCLEFEYPIPISDAEEILDNLCQKAKIEKTRYLLPIGQHTWELDVFQGDNQGLVVAEIELQAEDESFDLPYWVTEEVTHDDRYYNSNLLNHPFNVW